ncbi:uncharacterized protein LOC144872399 [Branchiostoma floridae x Branchiostoma japonicum]
MGPRVAVPVGLLVLLALAAGGTAQDNLQKITFPAPRSVSNYARLGTTLAQDLSSFTLCLHMRTDMSSTSHAGLVSYAVQENHNELLILNKGRGISELFVQGGKGADLGALPVWDGEWHAVCATWRSTDGAWQVYTDGVLQASGSGLKVGGKVRSGGTWILAQDQETVGGGFDPNQAFSGELSQVNLWDRVLTPAEVGPDSCGQHGNVIDWATTNIEVFGLATSDEYICDVDECADGTDNCHAQATCTNTDGSFTCDCTEGYSGNGVNCTDVDECADGTHNCHAQATCTNTDGSFICECTDGHGGDGVTCADIDECANGTHNCHDDATCSNTDGGFNCTCYEGYAGDGVTCTDHEVDIALGKPAFQTSTTTLGSAHWPASLAVDGSGAAPCTHTNPEDSPAWWVDLGQSYAVDRVVIFNRPDCCRERLNPFNIHIGDSDQVISNPRCGGDHHINVTHLSIAIQCQGMQGRFVAVRLPGHGPSRILTLCEVQVYTADPPDVDECADGTANCHSQATCTNTDGGFTCACIAGYTGDGVTCTDIDECANGTHNCHDHVNCTNTEGSFNCVCIDGYDGDGVTCSDIDECAAGTHNCHEDATCSNTDGGFNCTCYEGYAGDGVTCTGLSDLVFTDVGMDYMTLSWTAPVDLNITRYRLRYRPAGASHRDLSPAPSPGDTAATVPGLWADTEYTFTLTAFGDGDQEVGEISGTETTAEVIVNVECHEDHMTVTFPRAALPAVDVDNMHLLDASCGATITDTEVTLRAGLQDCGTIQDSSEADKFIFTNEAIANQLTFDNGAVRGTPFSKRFRCEFLRQYVVSQGREILYNIPSPRVQVVDAENSFTFEMHMFTSSDFTATYNSDDYPVQVTSADRLHFGLSVNSPLNDLELFALRCLATPSTDPDDSPSVSIIQDGCDVDTTLQLDTERSNDMALYYSIQSFTFPNIDDPSLVYIHCTMVVCFQSDPDSRCSQGCIPPSRRRRAVPDLSGARVRRASETDHITTISQGPFKVENGQEEAAPLPTVGIAVGTAAGIAGVLLVAAAAFLVRKRRGRGAKEQAADRVGFDNYSFELWGKDKAASTTPKPE